MNRFWTIAIAGVIILGVTATIAFAQMSGGCGGSHSENEQMHRSTSDTMHGGSDVIGLMDRMSITGNNIISDLNRLERRMDSIFGITDLEHMRTQIRAIRKDVIETRVRVQQHMNMNQRMMAMMGYNDANIDMVDSEHMSTTADDHGNHGH